MLLNQIDISKVMQLTYLRQKYCWMFYEIRTIKRFYTYMIYLTFTIDIFRLRNVLMKSFLYVGENIIIFHAYSPISYCTNIKTAKELPSNGSVPKCFATSLSLKYILRSILSYTVYCIQRWY